MSVLTKGLAMDFVRQGRTGMAITSIWPASVRATPVWQLYSHADIQRSPLSLLQLSITRLQTSRTRKTFENQYVALASS